MPKFSFKVLGHTVTLLKIKPVNSCNLKYSLFFVLSVCLLVYYVNFVICKLDVPRENQHTVGEANVLK